MLIASLKEKPRDATAAQESYPVVLKSFLQTCMKLLQDQNVVKGLQELIDNYTSKDNSLQGQRTVNKVNQRKKRTSREMWLTVQNCDFKMDQVILNLGSNANVLLKQTWEGMGKPKLQWSPI